MRSFAAPATPVRERSEAAAFEFRGSVCAAGGKSGGVAIDDMQCLADDGSLHDGLALREPRAGFGLAALADKVYAVGGASSGKPLASVEIWEPEWGAWKPGPALPEPRAAVAAAAAGGRIYVFGGADGRGRLSGLTLTLEPGARAWTEGAAMSAPRGQIAAAVVDGVIYAAGGALGDGSGETAQVESLDPREGRWRPRAALGLARAGAAAAAADGKLYVAGGRAAGRCLDVVEVYDPKSDRWSSARAMPKARCGASAAEHGGKLFVFGGEDAAGGRPAASIAVYDPASDAWSELAGSASGAEPRAVVPLAYGAAFAVDDAVCVAGGSMRERRLNSVLCVGADGRLHSKPDLPHNVNAAATVGGKVYAIAGMADKPLADVRQWERGLSVWKQGPALPEARQGTAAVALAEKLYLVGGGSREAPTRRVLVLDSRSGRWSEGPALNAGRYEIAAAAVDGTLYAAGGHTLVAGGVRMSAELESLDPREGRWRPRSPMPLARTGSAAAAAVGKLYVFGGNASGQCSSAVQVYEPRRDRWSNASPMPQPRCGATAAAWRGKLYVFGGSDTSGQWLAPTIAVYDPSRDSWMELDGTRSIEPARTADHAGDEDSDLDVFRDAAPRPDDFALIVGVEGYRAVPDADFAQRDAEAFARYAVGRLGVPAANTIVLKGSGAARSDIAKYLEEWLPKNVKPKSRVYFYYSGHGAPDPTAGATYLLPWDGDPDFLETSGYPVARLYEKLRALKAAETLVFLDSCFSGAGGRSVIAKGLRPLVNVSDPAEGSGGLSVMTAGTGSQMAGSLEERRHGLFTFYLLEGLRGSADADGDRHLALSELQAFVSAKVRDAAARANRTQTPQLRTPSPALRLY